jgi:hypothetical protein
VHLQTPFKTQATKSPSGVDARRKTFLSFFGISLQYVNNHALGIEDVLSTQRQNEEISNYCFYVRPGLLFT